MSASNSPARMLTETSSIRYLDPAFVLTEKFRCWKLRTEPGELASSPGDDDEYEAVAMTCVSSCGIRGCWVLVSTSAETHPSLIKTSQGTNGGEWALEFGVWIRAVFKIQANQFSSSLKIDLLNSGNYDMS